MRAIEEQKKRDLIWQEERRREDAKAREEQKRVENERQDARDSRVEKFQEDQHAKNRSRQFWNMLIGGLLTLVGGAIAKSCSPDRQPQVIVVPASVDKQGP